MISIVSMNVGHIGLATPKFVGFGWFDYQPNFNDKKVFLFLTIPENKLPGFETDYEMNNGTPDMYSYLISTKMKTNTVFIEMKKLKSKDSLGNMARLARFCIKRNIISVTTNQDFSDACFHFLSVR